MRFIGTAGAGLIAVSAVYAQAVHADTGTRVAGISDGMWLVLALVAALLIGWMVWRSTRRGSPPDGRSVTRNAIEIEESINDIAPSDDPVIETGQLQDSFTAEITLTQREEGGRAVPVGVEGAPQFEFGTDSASGQIILPQGTDGLSVDGPVMVDVALDHAVPLEVGRTFAIREAGRTIGFGTVVEREAMSAPPPEYDLPQTASAPDDAPPLPQAAPPTKMAMPETAPETGTPLPEKEEDAISFYFATSRKPVSEAEGWFGPERAQGNSYGMATVHVPPERKFGTLNRPFRLSIFSLTLYEGKENPKKHFIVDKLETLDLDSWKASIGASDRKDALIFVHGFNTSFEEATLRAGQIFWDLQYDGVPVMFSWASGGGVANYLYDQNSALDAGENFRTLLGELAASGVTGIKVLCHSMGNYMLMNALDGYFDEIAPFNLSEIMMAAPDVDRDLYLRKIPGLKAAVPGLTLYASAHDRALLASMKVAGDIPRAGFVAAGQPLLAAGVDTIDVSDIGEEMFGLGHGAYASQPSVLNDIAHLLNHGTRPPGKRLAQLRGLPKPDAPQWWKFHA